MSEGGVLLEPGKSVLGIVRFAYGRREHPAAGSWLAATCEKACRNAFIADVHEWWIDQAPLTAARNAAALEALRRRCTHVLFLDAADMAPDYLPGAPPFWDTAWSFVRRHSGPCVVSAPARARDGSVCVHKVVKEGELSHLRRMSAAECVNLSGVQRVPACNVALSLIDTRAFAALQPPWFRFVHSEPHHEETPGTEDVLFTADLAAVGVPSYVAWDCWNSHEKSYLLGKPGAGDIGNEVKENA